MLIIPGFRLLLPVFPAILDAPPILLSACLSVSPFCEALSPESSPEDPPDSPPEPLSDELDCAPFEPALAVDFSLLIPSAKTFMLFAFTLLLRPDLELSL